MTQIDQKQELKIFWVPYVLLTIVAGIIACIVYATFIK